MLDVEHVRNIKYDSSKHSVIAYHIFNKNHTFNWQNKKIIDHKSNYYKRLVSEMIYIKSQKNGINLVKDIKLLDPSYFNLLSKIFENKQHV